MNLDSIVVLFFAWVSGDHQLLVLVGSAVRHADRIQADHLRWVCSGAVRAMEQDCLSRRARAGQLLASGIKVLVLAVIVGIGTGLFAEFRAVPEEPSLDHALVVMLASLALLGLGIFGPG